MGQLENMQVFIKVVEAGSITRAAEQLNLAKSAVSKRLGELEQQLGVKLISRTTRRSSLTQAGQAYYQQTKLIVDEVNELNCQVSSTHREISGKLKLSVPLSFGISHLSQAFNQFTQLHPNVELDINFSDRKVNIIEDGFDVAIRIGNLGDSSLQAKALTPIKNILCASPSYIENQGELNRIEDLKQHQFLRYSQIPLSGIPMLDKTGKPCIAPITASCNANNGDFLKDMAIAGQGITVLPTFIAWKALQSGALVPVLTEYSLPSLHAYAVYPQTRFVPQKLRTFIDYLSDYFGDTPYWDR